MADERGRRQGSRSDVGEALPEPVRGARLVGHTAWEGVVMVSIETLARREALLAQQAAIGAARELIRVAVHLTNAASLRWSERWRASGVDMEESKINAVGGMA